MKSICPDCKEEREVGHKRYVNTRCRSCGCKARVVKDTTNMSIAAKKRHEKYGNPMQGKKHTNKEKFRGKDKVNATNINWDDIKETAYGAKLYCQTCIRCGADRGYKPSHDWKRTCWKCKSELATKYSDAHRRLRSSMKASVGQRLRDRKSSKGGNPIFSTVGYSLEELVKHLESKFLPGMNWDNYGNKPECWEIDHIRPDSSFDYDSYEHPQFKECWALSNLQPMWSTDNRHKSAKWEMSCH